MYLVFSSNSRTHYAMKVFPYKDQEMNKAYKREIRFERLSHPNILKFISSQPICDIQIEKQVVRVSYILMELASFGTFSDLLGPTQLFHDEKLVRTYFHQLIDGLEYLHSKDIAHLDLRLSNLLLGDDFKLKIVNFESAYRKSDESIFTKGCKDYRPPEIKNRSCTIPEAADIYSAGIVLFVLKTGTFPYSEDLARDENYKLYEYLANESENFWAAHEAFNDKDPQADASFKELFMGMTRTDPNKRLTIKEIKQSKWFKGPTYDEKELRLKMSKRL
jgi:Serine/threonine protein kinase